MTKIIIDFGDIWMLPIIQEACVAAAADPPDKISINHFDGSLPEDEILVMVFAWKGAQSLTTSRKWWCECALFRRAGEAIKDMAHELFRVKRQEDQGRHAHCKGSEP
jgi:hypothetical protein